jgi:RNA polymerase sigma-70 factor (ECF subfamily)
MNRTARREQIRVDGESGGTLAVAVHRGERDAVARLVGAYQDALFSYVLGLLRDPTDAQEVTQDAFLRAYRALASQYDEERCRTLNLRPWLLRIGRNLAYNRLRQRRMAATEPLPEPDGYHEPSLRSPSPSDGNRATREELAELESALARLSRAAREVVQLRFIDGLSYAEIATILGSSESSVRGKVFRALAQLRARLTEREITHAL